MIKAVFCGIKHSGKTTVGQKSALLLNLPFYDLDELIVKESREESVRELYRAIGKRQFQEREATTLRHFLAKERERSWILSVGGGLSDNQSGWELLIEERVTLFYLKEAAEPLYRRIIERGRPPFLDESDPWGSFKKLYKRRSTAIEKSSPIVLDKSQIPFDQLPSQAASLIREVAQL